MKITVIFFLLINCFCLNAQFDINDPRNPNCPCHKYQKIADDEYKRLLAKADNNPKRNNQDQANSANQHIENQQNSTVASENKKTEAGPRKNNTSKHVRRSFKRMRKKTAQFFRRFDFKSEKRITDKCFSWK